MKKPDGVEGKINKRVSTDKRWTESGNTNSRETTSALEPHNTLTKQGAKNLGEIEPLLLINARPSQGTKIAVKQLLLWSHRTH